MTRFAQPATGHRSTGLRSARPSATGRSIRSSAEAPPGQRLGCAGLNLPVEVGRPGLQRRARDCAAAPEALQPPPQAEGFQGGWTSGPIGVLRRSNGNVAVLRQASSSGVFLPPNRRPAESSGPGRTRVRARQPASRQNPGWGAARWRACAHAPGRWLWAPKTRPIERLTSASATTVLPHATRLPFIAS